MKTESKIKPASVVIGVVVILICLIGTLIYVKQKNLSETSNRNGLLLSDNILVNQSDDDIEPTTISNESIETTTSEQTAIEEIKDNSSIDTKKDENTVEKTEDNIVYDGLTKQQLIDKLNRNLNSTLSGKGELFANYALQYGIDPYLAVAIVLHETGCSWDCSDLVKYCYNVGGQKGSPNCGGGSYMAYSTLDEGIEGFMSNLYNNFYALGLTTPETINPKYAASQTWASSINNYINKIKAS